MTQRIKYLTDKYLEALTSSLYRELGDQDLCVQITIEAIR